MQIAQINSLYNRPCIPLLFLARRQASKRKLKRKKSKPNQAMLTWRHWRRYLLASVLLMCRTLAMLQKYCCGNAQMSKQQESHSNYSEIFVFAQFTEKTKGNSFLFPGAEFYSRKNEGKFPKNWANDFETVKML